MKKRINKKTILVVDDDKNFRQELAELFKDKYNLKFAENGAEAKKIIQQDLINIILLDLKLPDMHGLDLMKDIKKKAKSKNICVIVVTAYADLKSAIEAMHKDVCDYISKPIEPEVLIKRVEREILRQTAEIKLKRKLKELESFQEMATGRELKMIELKKEIKRLKKKCKKLLKEANDHKKEVKNDLKEMPQAG